MITVRLADGRSVTVQTDDPQRAAKIAHSWGQSTPHPEASALNEAAGVAGHYLDGILPGASGFVRGAREVVKNAVQAPFSDSVDFHPVQSYNEGRAFQEARAKMAERDHPTASNVASGAGIAASLALPAAKIAKGATLTQRAISGAKTAGAYGALSGAMSSKSDSLLGKAEDAISSGLASASVGSVMPFAVRGASALAAPFKPVTAPIVRVAGKGLNAVGAVLPGSVGRALAEEGSQLSRDPVRAAANVALDHDLRAATNPATGAPFTPEEVASEVRRRQSIGVPAALADVHESARRSYGAAARSPGPATAAVRRAIDLRQQRATERVAGHIADTLGPTTNVPEQAAALRQYSKDASAPLYDISDAQHIPYVQELQDLFRRPSARDAVQIAGRQILDKGENPRAFGLIEGPDGVFQMGPAPTMPLYDRVKTVLDRTVYDGNKPLASPEVTRASEGAMDIRNRLLSIMDGDGSGPRQAPARPSWQAGRGLAPVNPQGGRGYTPQLPPMQSLPPAAAGLPKAPPFAGASLPHPSAFPKDPLPGNPFPVPYEEPAQRLFPEAPTGPAGPQAAPRWTIPPEGLNPFWKPARDAYGGPIQAKQALELGQEMAKGTGKDIANRMGDLTGAQTDFFRLGHRTGLADDVKMLGDWGNAAARVAGSASKRGGLQAAHGPRANDLLDRTLAEHEAHQTWKAVRGNSASADRLAEMSAQEQQIEQAAHGVIQALAGNPGAGIGTALRALAEGDRNSAEIKGRIADVLGSTNLDDIDRALQDIARDRARKARVDDRTAKAVQQGSRFLGSILGTNLTQPANE